MTHPNATGRLLAAGLWLAAAAGCGRIVLATGDDDDAAPPDGARPDGPLLPDAPAGDFSLTVTMPVVTCKPGGQAGAGVEIARGPGFTAAVSVTLTDAPDTITTTPLTVAPGQTMGTLDIACGDMTAPGVYATQVVATALALRHMVGLQVEVQPPSGGVDPTFGWIQADLEGGSDDVASALALDPAGRIVVVGGATAGGQTRLAVARFNADGTWDSAFAGDGRTAFTLGTSGSRSWANAVAVDSSGGLVVTGAADAAGGGSDAVTVGLRSDGVTTFTFYSHFGSSGWSDAAEAVAWPDPNHVILAGGSRAAAAGGRHWVARLLLPTGNLDTTLMGGVAVDNFSATSAYGNALGLRADGSLVTAGELYNGANRLFLVTRYRSNGALDTGFAGQGFNAFLFSTDGRAEDLAIDADTFVAAGTRWAGAADGSADIAVVRVRLDGSLDPGFAPATNNRAVLVRPGDDEGNAVVVDGAGRILVAGAVEAGGALHRIAVLRLHPDGTPDASFGTAGLSVIPGPGSGVPARATGIAVQADGKIVVAGHTLAPSGALDLVLVRLVP